MLTTDGAEKNMIELSHNVGSSNENFYANIVYLEVNFDSLTQ